MKIVHSVTLAFLSISHLCLLSISDSLSDCIDGMGVLEMGWKFWEWVVVLWIGGSNWDRVAASWGRGGITGVRWEYWVWGGCNWDGVGDLWIGVLGIGWTYWGWGKSTEDLMGVLGM